MVSVYIKPTNFCNIGCEHCFLSDEVKADKTLMDMETLAQSAEFINQMQQDLNKTYKGLKTTIIFHGGEPLMAPLDWYEKATQIIDNTLQDKYSYAFQSSLMPKTDEAFFGFLRRKINAHVGTSLDWSLRKIGGSQEVYRRKFIKRVEEYRKNGIKCAPSLVVSNQDIGHERQIVDWFLENNFSSLQITRFVAWGYESELLPTNKEHSLFLIEVFKYLMELLEKKQKALSVKSIVAVLAGVLYEISSDTYSGHCQTLSFTIEPNGDIGMCPNRISYEQAYQNVKDGWHAFRKNKRRRKWILYQQLSNYCDKCTKCENIKWCKGNCPISPHDVGGKDDDCAGFKLFVDYVRDFMSNEKGKKLVLEYLQRYSSFSSSAKGQKND